jgi:hypothetical protein
MKPLLPLIASLALTQVALTQIASAQCEAQELRSENLGLKDRFGSALDSSGTTAVVGSPADDDGGILSGSVYVLQLTDVGWQQVRKLTAGDANLLDQLGGDVAIWGQDRIAAGAHMDDEGAANAGAAYVFERLGSTWSEYKLIAPDAQDSDMLGSFVDIDATTLIVGARGDDDGGGNSGSAYIFERDSSGWSFAQKLTASNAFARREFGRSGALSGDRTVVGAPAMGPGSVYVFEKVQGSWSETARLTPSGGVVGEAFGAACALDADRLAVGSPNRGVVYVFEHRSGGWIYAQKLTPAGSPIASFGTSIALLGDRMLVGARDDSGQAGAAFVFEHDGTSWSETARLAAGAGNAQEQLGSAVALSDGMSLVGAPDCASGAAQPRGSVRAFAFGGSDCNLNDRPDTCDVFDGTSPDLDLDGRPDECGDAIGTRYCFGDGGGTACPCANDSPLFHDEGCLNSVGVGAQLVATGDAALSADTLLLTTVGVPDGELTVFFQGTGRLAGGAVFGDGLLCVSGVYTRLGSSIAAISTAVMPRPGTGPISGRGSVLAPGTRTYQAWYRDPAGFCTGATYNLSGAVEVFWGP